MQVPRHLAIIMDGNGRWAQKRRLPRILGHQQGARTVQKIVKECQSLGVSYLTLYAFSSENWRRPGEEVNALMGLLTQYLRSELDKMLAEGVRLNVIGDIARLPNEVCELLQETMVRTACNNDMVLTLCLSYGARDEIVRAVRHLAEEVVEGRLDSSNIDENTIEKALDTRDLPAPDFLIRTSGEMRISNFLLWQLAYAELYFSKVLWPDFDEQELHKAFQEYGRRQRRYGLTGEQIKGTFQD